VLSPFQNTYELTDYNYFETESRCGIARLSGKNAANYAWPLKHERVNEREPQSCGKNGARRTKLERNRGI
jgi:hypothetical protein